MVAKAEACKVKKILIPIDVKGGSLEEDITKTYEHNPPEGMIDSAKSHVKMLEDLGFNDKAISSEPLNVRMNITVYALAANTFPHTLLIVVKVAGRHTSSAI